MRNTCPFCIIFHQIKKPGHCVLMFMGVTTTKYEKDEEERDTWRVKYGLSNTILATHKTKTQSTHTYSQKSAQ